MTLLFALLIILAIIGGVLSVVIRREPKRTSYRIKMTGQPGYTASGQVGNIDWQNLESWKEVKE